MPWADDLVGAAKPDHAPQATICWDPFHVVALGGAALDVSRREHWNHLRATADPAQAHRFKGARWALLRNPEDLTDRQADSLAAIRRAGGARWRAYQLKEALRAVFAGDLTDGDVTALLHRWCSRAQRGRLPAFVKLARTIREHRDGILATIRLGLSNGRVEGMNLSIKHIKRVGRGFRNIDNYRLRLLLHCGHVNWHTQPAARLRGRGPQLAA